MAGLALGLASLVGVAGQWLVPFAAAPLAAAPFAAAPFAAAPTPSPTPTFNPDDVTPGVVGFAFTIVIILLVGVIAWDLLRRIRRMRYRADVRARLEDEVRASGGTAGDAAPGTQPTGDGDSRGEGPGE